jgi:hypothetical protein
VGGGDVVGVGSGLTGGGLAWCRRPHVRFRPRGTWEEKQGQGPALDPKTIFAKEFFSVQYSYLVAGRLIRIVTARKQNATRPAAAAAWSAWACTN